MTHYTARIVKTETVKVEATVNYNFKGKKHEADLILEAIDLNSIYAAIESEYPTFTSAVVTFSKVED